MKTYKYKVDKKKLQEFLLNFNDSCLPEVKKVIFIVVHIHFPGNSNYKDLEDTGIEAIISSAKYYDEKYDPYNFIYSSVRNKVSNYLRKINRISLIEDITKNDCSTDEVQLDEASTLSSELQDILVGESSKDFVRIPRKDLLFIIANYDVGINPAVYRLCATRSPLLVLSSLLKFFKKCYNI